MKQPFDVLPSDGFVWKDPAEAAAKIDRYRRAGNTLLHVVSDWDGTIVAETGRTWDAMRDALPEAGRRIHRRLYRWYKPLEDSGQLTDELERAWSQAALALHVRYRTPVAALRASASNVPVRPGAAAAFHRLEEADVPVAILSSGVKDVIQIAAEHHGFHPAAVVATELVFDGGHVSGWVEDSLVTGATKRELGHPELAPLRQERPHALLLGNRPHDAAMFEGDGLRLRVDGHEAFGTGTWEAYLEESWRAGYDGVSIHDHLWAVDGLCRLLTTPPESAASSSPA